MKKNKMFGDEMVPELEVAGVEVSDSAVDTEREAEKLEAFKAKKREAAERFKNRKAEEKKERKEAAIEIVGMLKDEGIYDRLPERAKNFFSNIINGGASNGGGTSSLFKTLFGDNPQVGATITLNDAFTKTLKGKSNIDFYIKKWADKGTIVSFKQDAENILNSIYVLEAIGGSV